LLVNRTFIVLPHSQTENLLIPDVGKVVLIKNHYPNEVTTDETKSIKLKTSFIKKYFIK